jgi:hypothetical protein
MVELSHNARQLPGISQLNPQMPPRAELHSQSVPFEKFTKQLASRSQPLWVSIQRRGIFGLSESAYAALGEPEAVHFLFDRERGAVGLEAAPAGDADAYKVREPTTGTSRLVTGTKFTDHYGIPVDKGQRFEAAMEGHVLCFALDDGEVT